MEVTAEKIAPIAQPDAGLKGRLNLFMKVSGMNTSQIAAEIHYSRPTLSLYLSGKYNSDLTEIERQIETFLDHHEDTVISAPEAPTLPPLNNTFFDSRDARKILGVCQAAQEYREIGIITGRSGYGKTYALQEYARLPKVGYLECDSAMNLKDMIVEVERALNLPPISSGNHGFSNHERLCRVALFMKENPGYLLIVDEADKLLVKNRHSKIDHLREIFDKTGERGYASCGIILAGEPGLDTLITNALPRLANRTLLGAKLSGLTEEDVRGYLSRYDITPEAMTELKRRALNSRTGCFRLLERTLRNVHRILEPRSGATTITAETIRQATSLMIV